MSQPRNWWLGLVPLILLWFFANIFQTSGVEADIGNTSAAAMAEKSGGLIDKPAATVSGRDVTLNGVAFTPDAQKSAVSGVEAQSGVRLVNSAVTPLPAQKPYGFGIARDGDRIVLTGNVPLPAVRAALLEAAKKAFPGASVVDEMTYAAGAPQGFEGIAGWGIDLASKLGKGAFSLTDSAATVSGEAATSAIYEAAMASLKSQPAGASIAKADILPPEMKPYSWTAAFDGKALTLSGAAPSGEARDAIAAKAASLFGGAPSGKLDLARGATGDFAAATSFALSELAKLVNGRASLVDGVLTLSGEGRINVTGASVTADAKAGLPSGYQLGKLDIVDGAISPFGFTATKDKGALTLSGYVPDDKTRADLLDVIKRKFFDTKVDDKLALGKGAPQGFGAAASALLGGLSRLASGVAGLSGGDIDLKGDALYDNAIDKILASIKGALPAGFALKQASLGVASPGAPMDSAACQPLFENVLGKGRILFETGSARIDADSAAILDNLVAVSMRCGGATIEIGGHTDSVGSSEANVALSKKRAEAVVGYLTEAGIDGNRLSAEGYGETKPIASNDNDEGRAQNRRIEFLVR